MPLESHLCKCHLGIINDIQQPSEGRLWVFTKRLSSYKSEAQKLKFVKSLCFCENSRTFAFAFCGNSSVGRARPCQGRGREFESRLPLTLLPQWWNW